MRLSQLEQRPVVDQSAYRAVPADGAVRDFLGYVMPGTFPTIRGDVVSYANGDVLGTYTIR